MKKERTDVDQSYLERQVTIENERLQSLVASANGVLTKGRIGRVNGVVPAHAVERLQIATGQSSKPIRRIDRLDRLDRPNHFDRLPRRGPLRVGFILPQIDLGGAEQWLLSLLACRDKRIQWYGVALTTTNTSHPGRVAIALKHAQVAVTTTAHSRKKIRGTIVCKDAADAVRTISAKCDAMVAWGIDCLQAVAGDFGGPLVLLSHGACAWTRRTTIPCQPRATHFVAVSEPAATAFEGVPVEIIHNGADAARCRPSGGREKARARIRKAWGLRENEKAVGFVGRFSWEKNPLAAAIAVATLGKPYRAVYVGDGWKAAEVNQAVANILPSLPSDMPGGGRVPDPQKGAIFVPPTDNVGDVLAALDCYVLASPSEGCSLGMMEAMFAGVPVVATRVGAVPELEAKHGPMVVDVPVCASPVELAAAVRKATSKGKRAMVERVKKIVGKNYTTEVLGKRWCDYLVEIAAAGHAECSRRHRIN